MYVIVSKVSYNYNRESLNVHLIEMNNGRYFDKTMMRLKFQTALWIRLNQVAVMSLAR